MSIIKAQLEVALEALESAASVAASVNTILNAHIRILDECTPDSPEYAVSTGAALALFEVLDHAGVEVSPQGLAVRQRLFPFYKPFNEDDSSTVRDPGIGVSDYAQGVSVRDTATYYRNGDELIVNAVSADGIEAKAVTELHDRFPDDKLHDLAVGVASLFDVPAENVSALSVESESDPFRRFFKEVLGGNLDV